MNYKIRSDALLEKSRRSYDPGLLAQQGGNYLVEQKVMWKSAVTAFLRRVRYPMSMPEEVGAALGVEFSRNLPFKQFVQLLSSPQCRVTRLSRYMPRAQAEAAFMSALRRESFRHNSLFSYYFHGGWIGFTLDFDEKSRLRRLYLQHPDLPDTEKVEIPLPT